MMAPAPSPTPRQRGARPAHLFAVLLFLFVLVRGLNLAAIQMPFNGWDEYQHLAVAHVLETTGRMPALTDTVPEELWPFLRAHPHPPPGAIQLAGLGAVDYRGLQFDAERQRWMRARGLPPVPEPPELYQAQHPPLFYRAFVLMKRLLGIGSMLAWADAGRALNVFLAGLTAVLWFAILRRVLAEGGLCPLGYGVALLFALTPLFAYDAARVANDMLALAFASAAIGAFFLFCSRPETPGRRARMAAGMVGLLAGSAVLAKGIALPAAAALGLGFAAQAFRRTSPRAWGSFAAFSLGYLLVTAPYHLHCVAQYGTITGTLFAVENVRAGHDLGDQARALVSLLGQWENLSFLVVGLLAGFADFSGWSFIPAHTPRELLLWAAAASVLLLFAAILHSRTRARLQGAARAAWLLLALLGMTWLAMLYYGAHSLLAIGAPLTLAWYGMLAYPVTLGALLLPGFVLHRWVGLALVGLYAAIFQLIHTLGTYRDLLQFQVHTTVLRDAAAEIAQHHAWLRLPLPYTLGVEWALFILLASSVAYRCAVRERTGLLGTAC